jgi:hypothetical protein
MPAKDFPAAQNGILKKDHRSTPIATKNKDFAKINLESRKTRTNKYLGKEMKKTNDTITSDSNLKLHAIEQSSLSNYVSNSSSIKSQIQHNGGKWLS